jgi:hypothetical protein
MGSIAVASSTSKAISTEVGRFVGMGLGVGGLFVAVALVVVLVYLDLLDASAIEDADLRQLLVATMMPLLVTFLFVVLYQSAAIV